MRIITQAYSTIAEGSQRQLKGTIDKLVTVFCIGYALYHIYVLALGHGKFDFFQHRATHLLLILLLAFILYSWNKKKQDKVPVVDIVLASIPLIILAYMLIDLKHFTFFISQVSAMRLIDIVFGSVLVLLILEGARRVTGMPVVIVTVGLLLYLFFGQHLPGLLWHAEIPFDRAIDILFISGDGIFGDLMEISATYIILYIIFGQMLLHLGGGQFFIDFANAIAGGGRGGAAKVAVVSSAMFGTVSGSGVANVATTGAFTIPMMKKMGFRAAFAGAVELSASTGGMITPPVMAALAFLMSDITGIPYIEIIIAAAIPAVLYFFAIFLQVHMESLKLGIGKIPKEERPSLWKVLREGGQFLLPLVIITVMLAQRYTPIWAGIWAMAATIAAALVRKDTRKDIFVKILRSLEDGTKTVIVVVLAIAAGSLMIGVILPTGLGGKFGSAVMLFAQDNLLLVLIFAMVASLILGAPLSVTATYILTAIMIAPVAISMGVPKMAAHLFAVYFACLSGISPPSGAAMFMAGGLAKANPMTVGFLGMRLAIGGFIVPFMFTLNPALLLMGNPMEIIIAFLVAVIAILGLAAGFEGWIIIRANWWERILLIAGGFLLVFPSLTTLSIGGSALAAAFLLHLVRTRFSTKTL